MLRDTTVVKGTHEKRLLPLHIHIVGVSKEQNQTLKNNVTGNGISLFFIQKQMLTSRNAVLSFVIQEVCKNKIKALKKPYSWSAVSRFPISLILNTEEIVLDAWSALVVSFANVKLLILLLLLYLLRTF